MATKKAAAAAADQGGNGKTVGLSVRTRTLPQRFRAGFGPFGREPVAVQATPMQAELLRADPELTVEELV